MKRFLIYILLALTMNSFCQTGILKGSFRNGVDHTPSRFITVVLYQNDKLITGTNSDSTGHFEIKNISPGEYELEFSFVGYQSYVIPGLQVFNDSTVYLQTNYPCPNSQNKSKKICPFGHSDEIIPIVYGLPTQRTLERAEKGRCELGGCMVTECDPQWYCKKHKISF